jgi:hypothetical protein
MHCCKYYIFVERSTLYISIHPYFAKSDRPSCFPEQYFWVLFNWPTCWIPSENSRTSFHFNFYLILRVNLLCKHKKIIRVFLGLEEAIPVAPSAQPTVLSPELVRFLLGTDQTAPSETKLSWPRSSLISVGSQQADFRLLALCKWDRCSCGMLHGADCELLTDVSGQPIGPIFKGQAVFLDCLTLEDETNKLPETSANNYQCTPRNIPEERRSHL